MKRLVGLLLATLVVTAGCSQADLPEGGELEIVATASPLFDAAGGVGGDRVHAVNLLPIDPYGPVSEEKQQQLLEADLVIMVGQGVQPEVDAVLEGRESPTIALLDSIESDPEFAPFPWLDPMNMAVATELIRAELSSIDQEGSEDYLENASDFAKLLADVDRIHYRTLETCKRNELVTTDPRFSFLLDRYGIEQREVAQDEALEVATNAGATTVFNDELVDYERAKSVYEETGIRYAVMDDMMARTDQARRGGAAYGPSMALNLDALRAALDCKELDLSKDS